MEQPLLKVILLVSLCLLTVGTATAITTGGTLSSYWWINTTEYQANVREGVIEDLYSNTQAPSFNWGRDYLDNYSIGTVNNATPNQMLGLMVTNTNCVEIVDNASQYSVSCNNSRAYNNWTFYDTYIKLETTSVSQSYSVRHAITQSGTNELKYAWNGTANKTASVGVTDWDSKTGVCAYTMSNTSRDNNILAVTWNEATTTDVDYATNQSLGTTGCGIARGSELSAGTWLTQYIKILARNTSATGDEQVLTAINAFKANPLYPINTTPDAPPTAGDIYISKTGSDSNSGNSTNPIKTISKLQTMISSGKNVYFKCGVGEIWREPIDGYLNESVIPSGSSVDYTTLATYGTCNSTNRPKFTTSVNLSTGDWTQVGTTSLWYYTPSRAIANIVFGTNLLGSGNHSVGYRHKDSNTVASLNRQGDWWQNRSSGSGDYKVYINSSSNPVTYYNGLDVVYAETSASSSSGTAIQLMYTPTSSSRNYINITGLELMWSDYGINFEGHHIVFQDNYVHHIGGGYCTGGCTGFTRWGNAIQAWWAAHDTIVTNNLVWEVYDAGLTIQASGSGAAYNTYNHRFTNNIVWNSGFCIEFMETVNGGNAYNINIANNTCYKSGYSMFDQQRTNDTDQTTRPRAVRFGGSYGARAIYVKGNLFYDSLQYIYNVQGGTPGTRGWSTNYTIDYNYLWKNTTYGYDTTPTFQTNGATYYAYDGLSGTAYSSFNDWKSGSGKDQHSMSYYLSPTAMFTDPTNANNYARNFTPKLTGLCAGNDGGGYIGAIPCESLVNVTGTTTVNITSPANGTSTTGNVTISYYFNSDTHTTLTCEPRVDGVAINSVTATEGITYTASTNPLVGNHTLEVVCMDLTTIPYLEYYSSEISYAKNSPGWLTTCGSPQTSTGMSLDNDWSTVSLSGGSSAGGYTLYANYTYTSSLANFAINQQVGYTKYGSGCCGGTLYENPNSLVSMSVPNDCLQSTIQIKTYASAPSQFDYYTTNTSCYDGSGWVLMYSEATGHLRDWSYRSAIWDQNSSCDADGFDITAVINGTSTSLDGWTVFIDGVEFDSVGGKVETNHRGELADIIVTKEQYYNFTLTDYDTSNDLVANLSQDESYLPSQVTIAAYRYGNNVSLQSFSVTLENSTDSATYSVSDYLLIINITKAIEYNITINASGYYGNSTNLTTSSSTAIVNLSLRGINYLNITFYDEHTMARVTANVSLDFISDYYAANFTAENGTVLISGLGDATYTLRYFAPGFTTRFYTLTVDTSTDGNLDLYLVNSTYARNITVTVIDELNNPQEGVVVKALKYNLVSNSYVLQESSLTNLEGEVVQSLTLNDEFYKFMVELNGAVVKITEPAYVTGDLTIVIPKIGSYTDVYYNHAGISHVLTFNNETNNFRLDYSYNNGLGCNTLLVVYDAQNFTYTLLGSDSGTSCSGSLLYHVEPVSGQSFIAYAYYYDDDQSRYQYLTSYYYSSGSEVAGAGKNGLLAQALLTLGVSSIAFVNAPAAMVLAPLSLFLGRIVGLNDLSYVAITGLIFVGMIFMMVLMGNKR